MRVHRNIFRGLMLFTLLTTASVMLYETGRLSTLSDALVDKEHWLSIFIALTMFLSCLFFYSGYCRTGYLSTIPSWIPYILVLLVLLLVFTFDVKHHYPIHYMLLLLYVLFTWWILFTCRPKIWSLLILLLLPCLFFFCNDSIAWIEFLYLGYIILLI